MHRIAAIAALTALVSTSACATARDRYAGGGALIATGAIVTTYAATYKCKDSDEFLGDLACSMDKTAGATLGVTTALVGLILLATAPGKARREAEEAAAQKQQQAAEQHRLEQLYAPPQPQPAASLEPHAQLASHPQLSMSM